MPDPNQNDQNQNKFAPPPSLNFIRTMEKDKETFRQGGGQLPTLSQLPQENKPAPTPTFLDQNSAPAVPQFNVPPPPRPPSEPLGEAGGPPIIPVPETFRSGQQPEPMRSKPNPVQKYLIIAGPIIAILLIAGGWYFIRHNSQKPSSNYAIATPLVSASPAAVSPINSSSPLPSPSPFIALTLAPTKSESLIISSDTSATLMQAISNRASQTEQARTMVELMPQDSSGGLSANQLLSLMAQNVPPTLNANLGSQYLLFLYYSQPNTPYLGAIFSINPANILSVQSLFQSWETANIDSDLSFIFLGKATGGRSTPNFQTGTYKGVQTHYVVYKTPGLALNYAFLNNYLIIAANKDPLFAAIDHLNVATPSTIAPPAATAAPVASPSPAVSNLP